MAEGVTEAFALAVDALAPTSLAIIDGGASLQTRVDRKYVVEPDLAAGLVSDFNGSVLDIDARREFGYETTYYDTPALDLYFDTAYRRPKRFKARVRRYLDSGLTMLEVKTKNGRGKTVKFRSEYELDSHIGVEDTVRAFVDDSIVTDLTADLAPTLVTTFVRTTLLDADGNSRYTLDRQLAATATDGRVVAQPAVIVESKSSGATSPVDRWLWSHGVRPTRISKYCTSLAVLNPELPANHWHRTLKRHYGVDGSHRPTPIAS